MMVDVAPFVAATGDSAPPAGPGILQSAQAADIGGALGEPIGLILEAVGEVLLLHADGTTETVSSGMPVFVDDLVSTGAGGAVEIVFVDGTTFSLGANGQMRLDNLVFDPASGNNGLDATVVKGSFIFITGQIGSAEGEGVQIDTPAGTIGIRGTSGAGAQDPLTGAWIFTLFRDPDGTLSRFAITNPAGAQLLDQEFESTQIAGQFIRPSQTFVLSPGEAAALFSDALAVLQEQFPQLQNPERRGELNDIVPAAGEQFALSFGIPLPTAASLGDLYGLDLLAQTLANLLAAGGLGATELNGGVGSVGGSSTESFLPVPPDNQPAPPVDVDLDANEIEEGAETGAVANIQALANDPRFTGPVTYSLLDDAGGAFTIDPVSGIVTVADGSLLDFESGGTITIVVQASDGIHSSAAPLTITLTDVNEPPTAIELSNFVVGENQPGAVIGTLTAVDVDKADSAKFSVSDDRFEVVDGDLKLKDGVSLDHESSDKISVTVTATDKGGLSFSQTFEITVADADDPPNALPDAYAVDEDGTLAVSVLDGVLANDGDPDGDELTATLVDGPAHGKLTFSPDGSFTYTPAADYEGPDSFTYKASDGTAGSTVVTVNLSVAPKNDTPVAGADAYEIAEDGELVVPGNAGVLANDSDVDGDDLSAVLVSGPSHGVLTLNPDGSFTYTPDEDFTGEDSFAYEASDGALSSDPVTVRLTIGAVPDAPTANDDSGTVLEDGPAAAINLTGNDTDPDSGDDLEVTALGLAGTKGLATIAADGEGVVYDPNGKFEFLAAGETATDTFTYTVSDGHGGTDTATVTVTVTGANDGPTANDDSDTISEDGPATAINLAGNDSDPDASDDLDVTALGLAETTGKVTIAANGEGVIYDPDGKFDFLADGETATDTFTYTVSDGHGGTDTATVTVTITGANDGPTAVSDSDSVAEDGLAKSIKLTDNDSDPDANDDLEVTALDLTGTKGKVTIAADGEGVFYDPDGQFQVLADGETATDTFVYTVSDGRGGTDTATVTVTITGANDGPTANDDGDTVSDVGPAKTINLTGNDTDPDASDDLEVTALDLTGTKGLVTIAVDGEGAVYDPNGQFEFLADGETSTDTFAYTVSDGHGGTDTATVTVTVTGANDGPTANGDSEKVSEDGPTTAINLTGNDSDPDSSDDLEVAALDLTETKGLVTIAADGEGVIYDANGKFEFLADGETATDTFTYTVSDGHGGTDTATVTVTITGANDGPTAGDDSDTVSEDGPAKPINLTGNDSDPDTSDDLEVTALGLAETLGKVTIAADGEGVVYDSNGKFEFLADGETATDVFTYTVSDGHGGTDTATVTVTITGANDAPTANDDSDAIAEDGPPKAINLTGNDSDPDASDDLEVTALGLAATLGKVTIAADGEGVIYDANGKFDFLADGETATDTFVYTVSDGHGGTDTATVTFTITGANDAPQAEVDSYRIDEDGKLSVKASAGVLANDTDVDGDELTALLVAGPAHGTLTLNPDGSFVYAPGENFSGEDSFTYKASDGTDSSETATVTIDVKSVNDAPEAGDDGPFTTGENEPVAISIAELLANDIDTDGDILVLTKVEPLTGGSAIIEGGNIIFQPAHGIDGEAKFAYTVSDGQGGTDTAVVTVDVADDAPTATDDSAETADRTTQAINLVIIFDRSGSMGQSPGVPGFSTRQELANAAVAALFEAYGSIATLNIQIVDFAGTASQSGWLTTAEAANAYLAGLTPSGGTNYAAAIQTAMSAYASAPPADQAEVYFLSDGEPNAGQSLREAGLVGTWEAFLSNPANNIDRAFAVGIGGIQPGDPDLADVAFPNNDPSTLIVVTDESQLVDTLVGTVANTVSGNVLENDQFGADGPGNGGFGLLSITVDNVKYTYDGTEITAEGNPSEPPLIAGAKLVVVTGLGGTLEFHFDSGDYNYVAPDVTKTASEEFAYVIVDGDGTMDDATLHIDITDSGIVTRDPSTIIGKDGPDSLTGGTVDDVMSGGNGNDTILGNAGNDHIQGGAGDDSLSGGTGADVVIGGAGNDSIRLVDVLNFAAINGGGTVAVSLAGDAGDRLLFDGKLDLTSPVGDRIEGIETLSMADGSGDDGLIIAAADIIGIGTGRFDPPGSFGNFGTLSDAPTVRIDGDKGDTLTLADGGWVKFTGTAAPLVPGYDLYVHDAPGGAVAEDAYLLVQSIITVNVG